MKLSRSLLERSTTEAANAANKWRSLTKISEKENGARVYVQNIGAVTPIACSAIGK